MESDTPQTQVCEYIQGLLEELLPRLKGKINLCFNLLETDKRTDEAYEIMDSRLESLKYARIDERENKILACWEISLSDPSTERNSRFLKMLVQKILKEKFTDLIQFEKLGEIISYWKKGEKLENPRREHYFGVFLDREQFCRSYMEEIFINEKLPDKRLITQISAQFYEKRPLDSTVYFVNEEDYRQVSLSTGIRIKAPSEQYVFETGNLRTIRKLMEAGTGEQGLVVTRSENGNMLICMIAPVSDLEKEFLGKCVYIEFKGHLNWKVCKGNSSLIWHRDGEYFFPGLNDDEVSWEEDIKGLDSISGEQRELIINIVKRLKEQRHGTSLVFFDTHSLEMEVRRLSAMRRLHEVETFPLLGHEEQLLCITSIDGALMADVNGECHAFGCILDGDAVKEGDPGRGSRYNSIANYVRRFCQRKRDGKGICFAVVLSEDGFVNVVR